MEKSCHCPNFRPLVVNVTDSIVTGEQLERKYIAILPNWFYNSNSSPHQDDVNFQETGVGKEIQASYRSKEFISPTVCDGSAEAD